MKILLEFCKITINGAKMNNKLGSIIKLLGKPYYENEYGAIFNIDCLQALAQMPDDIIDQTFTSPPYNIGKSYEKIMEVEDYVSWCSRWLNALYNKTTDSGSLWLNIGYFSIEGKGRAVPIAYYLWDKSPFYLQQEIVWNYGAGVAAKKYLSPRNEKILWFVKNQGIYTFNLDEIRDKDIKYPNQKKHGKLRCNSIGKNPSDVWQIAKVTSGENRSSSERVNHPAQTPIDLLDRILLAGSNVGELVVDPFMGSGSTFVSSIKHKRFFIGFEINKDYCDLAANRVEHFLHTQIPVLF